MTVQQQVRRRLDELVPRFWTDDDVEDWCLEAANDVARRTETLQQMNLITIDAGANTLALPDNLLRVHLILWRTRNPQVVRSLPYVARAGFRPQGRLGEPWCYSMWAKEVTFDKTTTRDTAAYVLYYRTPDTSVDIPAGWEDLIVDYCEYQALRKDADPRHADSKLLYETKLQLMMETTRHWTDQAGIIAPEGAEFYFSPEPPPPQAGWDDSDWDVGVWA